MNRLRIADKKVFFNYWDRVTMKFSFLPAHFLVLMIIALGCSESEFSGQFTGAKRSSNDTFINPSGEDLVGGTLGDGNGGGNTDEGSDHARDGFKSNLDNDSSRLSVDDASFVLGCPASRKIWVGGCHKWRDLNSSSYRNGVRDCWVADCPRVYGPRESVCDDILNKPPLHVPWIVASEPMQLCTARRLPKCSQDWQASGQRFCSLAGDSNLDPVSPEPGIREVLELGESDCPKERTMYAQLCEGKAPDRHNGYSPPSHTIGPHPDVCRNGCVVSGGKTYCDSYPVAGASSFKVCSHNELPACPSNWRVQSPRLMCYL